MFDKLKGKYPEDARLLEKLRNICGGKAEFAYVDGIDAEKAENYNSLFRECCGENAVVVDVSTLMSELIELIIANSDTDAFYDKYKNCSVLVLNDFQFCFGKSATQDELYKVLRYRADNNLATVVFSSFSPERGNCMLADGLFDLLTAFGS